MSTLIPPVHAQDHSWGAENALVTLVEYGDYQCPHCVVAHFTVQTLLLQFEPQLRFVFRHFPQRKIHRYAQNAAEATEAAAMQNKFWEMHQCLLERQTAIAPQASKGIDDACLVECAIAIGLDVAHFLQDMAADAHATRVQQDVEGGIQGGVTTTPTFFINGVRYAGTVSMTMLSRKILELLDPNL